MKAWRADDGSEYWIFKIGNGIFEYTFHNGLTFAGPARDLEWTIRGVREVETLPVGVVDEVVDHFAARRKQWTG